jgi:hypothetical protein
MGTFEPTRRFERVRVTLPVTGFAPQLQGTALLGTVWYLSEGGMMVDFPVEVMRGNLVRVFLSTSHMGLFAVEGTVVWSTAHGSLIRHGVAFPEPKGPDFIQRVLGDKR